MDIKQNFYEIFLIILMLCVDSGISSIVDEMDYFDETSANRCPWIRNKLKNGRVRYRYKGRVAKFLCDSGFELAGKRSSTCVRGQWSNPVPVCVARGCSRVPSISNGRITEMYRGALLVYDCNPGYVLDGNPTIHCDGRRWNTSPPACVIATENPETYCDFENPELCGWSQDPNHDFDWQRNQFATPSGHVGTGPSFDHTFGENKGGFYLYIEASSPRKLNDTARLFSPVYSPDLSGGCFIFWYHMYGATTGGLRVYLKPESHVFDELKPKWEKYGDLGNQWLKGLMIVPVLHENFQIVIEGVRGESYVGDSAIDDVRLTSNLCDSDDNSTDVTESISHYSCRGRCQEAGTESSCGCNAHCVNEPNFCCRDYYAICSIGNFTTIRNTDEPPPEDYTTSSFVVTHSILLTTTEQSEESPIITTQLQTEKSEITYKPSFITSSTTSSTISLEQNVATKTTENMDFNLDINSTEQHTSTEIINVPQTPATTISNSEASLVSTKNTETIQISSLDSSTTTSSTSTSTPATTPTTTSSTVVSTTPQMTSTTAIITTKSTTQSQSTTEQTSELINRTLTQKFDFNMTTPSIPITIFVSNATTLRSTSIFASHVSISTTTTTTAPNTEPISVPTSTFSSTRKTYNLRPRNRTVSTTDNDMLSPTKPTAPRPRTKIITSDSTFTTSSRYLTSWYKYSMPSNAEPKTTSSSTSDTTTHFTGFPEDTSKNTITKKYSNRFTRPTKSTFPTSSNFYESKTTTTSNNSNVSIVVSIIIVILLCLIAGLVYYFRKQRNKRQSKLSDDSEMRFLPDSDYMEYSDASALDRILVK